MKFYKLKKSQKRLVKKAAFFDSYDDDDAKYGFVSIFENPTSTDISEAKEEGGNTDAIRGIIADNGITYCWTGIALHSDIPRNIGIDMDAGLRFAYESGEWIIDLNRNMTFEEGIRRVSDNMQELLKFGSIEGKVGIFFGSDNEHDYEKYDEDGSYLTDVRSQMLGFDNFGALQMFIRNMDVINN